MDNLFYLYKLTLLNYISEEEYEDNPLYETYLINFINSNKSILASNKLIFNMICYLTLELDRLYFDSAKKDVLKFIKKPCKKDRLWGEVKIFSKKIKEL
jgi:hypothetical protein